MCIFFWRLGSFVSFVEGENQRKAQGAPTPRRCEPRLPCQTGTEAAACLAHGARDRCRGLSQPKAGARIFGWPGSPVAFFVPCTLPHKPATVTEENGNLANYLGGSFCLVSFFVFPSNLRDVLGGALEEFMTPALAHVFANPACRTPQHLKSKL